MNCAALLLLIHTIEQHGHLYHSNDDQDVASLRDLHFTRTEHGKVASHKRGTHPKAPTPCLGYYGILRDGLWVTTDSSWPLHTAHAVKLSKAAEGEKQQTANGKLERESTASRVHGSVPVQCNCTLDEDMPAVKHEFVRLRSSIQHLSHLHFQTFPGLTG